MTTSLIAFGANLGNRVESLDQSCQRLSSHEEITLVARSRPYQTSPIGGPAGQEDFLNAALLVDTSLSPQQLLLLLQTIETELGRERQQRWDQRPIDLDLLLYDTLTIDEEKLQVPHPHMAFRRFVLEPAVEIAPALIHPSSGWTIQQLYEHLNTATNYLALIDITELSVLLCSNFVDNAGYNSGHMRSPMLGLPGAWAVYFTTLLVHSPSVKASISWSMKLV